MNEHEREKWMYERERSKRETRKKESVSEGKKGKDRRR